MRWHLGGQAEVPVDGADAFTPVDGGPAGFILDVLVLTRSERLARDVERVCCERCHGFMRITRLADLQAALQGSRSSVLLLDAESVARGLRIATTVAAVHENVPIVLVAEGLRSRVEGGFRVVDTWRAGERYVDELELAYIGIPAVYEGAGAVREIRA